MIKTLSFKVQGSAAKPYDIRLRRDGGTVIGSCTCKAGTFGPGHCKHLRAVLTGEPAAARLAAGTVLESALLDFTEADDDLAGAKRRRDEASRILGGLLRG